MWDPIQAGRQYADKQIAEHKRCEPRETPAAIATFLMEKHTRAFVQADFADAIGAAGFIAGKWCTTGPVEMSEEGVAEEIEIAKADLFEGLMDGFRTRLAEVRDGG